MFKIIKRNCLLFAVLLMLVSISGCGIQDSRLKKDAKAYMEMKGLVSEALEEYYAMLERPRDMVAEDAIGDSETSNYMYFYNKLIKATQIGDTIKSEEFSELILMNTRSIFSLQEAYTNYGKFCQAMYLYNQDKSVYYNPEFHERYKNCYAEYENYNQLFDEYYGKVQEEEDSLNSLGVFEGLHWDSEED